MGNENHTGQTIGSFQQAILPKSVPSI